MARSKRHSYLGAAWIITGAFVLPWGADRYRKPVTEWLLHEWVASLVLVIWVIVGFRVLSLVLKR